MAKKKSAILAKIAIKNLHFMYTNPKLYLKIIKWPETFWNDPEKFSKFRQWSKTKKWSIQTKSMQSMQAPTLTLYNALLHHDNTAKKT